MGPRTPNPSAPRRSREDVVDAALDLLDRVGLPDLSMRRLADDIGVQPSALYWHVANKQDLLAAVSARILAPLADDPADAADLATTATVLGHRLHDLLRAHRDGAEVVSSSLALGLVPPPLQGPLRAAGGPAAEAVADAVTHFVVGFTFHEQQRRAADALGVAAAPTGVSPATVAAAADEGFAAALDLIAAGVRARTTPA